MNSMNQFTVTGDTATFIAARIAGFPTEADARRLWLAPFVAKFSALPLYVGWTETIGIRVDGEIVTWSTEGEFAGVGSVHDQTMVLISLVAGSDRYPELRRLLPQRGPGAMDCGCRDVPLLASHKAFCGTCGGLGWLPKQDEQDRKAKE